MNIPHAPFALPRYDHSIRETAGQGCCFLSIGLPPDSVSTMFEFIDLDEGRPLKFG